MAEKAEDRSVLLKKVVAAWNGFIKGLIQAENSWEKYVDFCLDNRIGIEEFPLEVQKLLYRANPKGEFSVIIEDFITAPIDFKDCLLKLETEVKEDE